MAIEAYVLAGDDGSGKLRHREWKWARLAESLEDCCRKGGFGMDIERDVVAGIAAKLTECGNVRANNATAGQQRFDDRQAETFDGGRSGDGFAIAITPLESGFGEPLAKKDGMFKTASTNLSQNAAGFRAVNANDDQARGRVEIFGVPEVLEDPYKERDVLVAAMLCDAEEEGFSAPAGKRSLRCENRAGFDTVIDTACNPLHVGRNVVAEAEECGFGDAGNRIGCAQALP